MWANWYFAPPPKPKPVAQAAKEKADEAQADAKEDGGKTSELKADPEFDSPPEPDREGTDTTAEKPEEPPAEDDTTPARPTELAAIGSLDPASGYKMLALFTTKGASLKRLELTDPHFKDVEIEHGYLGHLELQFVADGLQVGVNLEGTGTPAAKAGLRKDDILTSFNGKKLDSVSGFQRLLARTRPRDSVELTVRRGDQTLKIPVTLIRAPQQLIRPDHGIDYDDIPANAPPRKDHPYSFRFTLAKAPDEYQDKTKNIAALLTENWELVSSSPNEVKFEWRLTEDEASSIGLEGAWRVEKTFRVAKSTTVEGAPADAANARRTAAQHLTWDIQIHNDSDKEQVVNSWIEGPTGLPSEGWWYSYKIHPSMGYSAGARDVVFDSPGQGYKVWGARSVFQNSYTKPEKNLLFSVNDAEPKRELDFIGVDTQYFAAILIPGTVEELSSAEYRRGEAVTWDEGSKPHLNWAKAADISFNLQSLNYTVGPSGAASQSFVIYAGPKDPDLAAVYGVDECVYYGWFGIVSTPLLHLLHLFSFMGYGLAIIMLTLLVRACLWPLSRKAARNAQMMQVLKPEMDVIREKYKNDMEKQGQAQRELMAKYNVNPFGGCLLMFFQMPVFLGLYRGLSVDLELRDQPLIPGISWADNLAAPDRLYNWGTSPEWIFGETGWLGPYLNILPLVTVGLFILQQKLFMPPATDDQTRAQQKMMNVMMIMMGLMFFKVPSGLCLYFITTSLFSIVERLVLPPAKPQEKALADASKPQGEPRPSLLGMLGKGTPAPLTPEQQKQEKRDRAKARQKNRK
ncbi:YidC/Oxa1 family insertase periplasmic-domain containing protein [Lignipirellula cremea]|uniref:Membrane protein insertase YidC n=1 Tax=Lignipirellula cremea TaxID=2528010 RepID=A0A518DVR1_9BACT|nr:YidC/Oxa1 family insertase periplasmic-domain containing protein [Lignipirellula cremea]QDU95919.1 Membrane protein insertase YidC [Lignipirellula cremea]